MRGFALGSLLGVAIVALVGGIVYLTGNAPPTTMERLDMLETQVHAIEDAIHCTGGSVPILVDNRIVGCQMPH